VSQTYLSGLKYMKLGVIDFIYSGWKAGVNRQGLGFTGSL